MPPPTPSLFPYTTLFRSLPGEVDMMAGGIIIAALEEVAALLEMRVHKSRHQFVMPLCRLPIAPVLRQLAEHRTEEHTSELQSHSDLVCRLLLEKKNQYTT